MKTINFGILFLFSFLSMIFLLMVLVQANNETAVTGFEDSSATTICKNLCGDGVCQEVVCLAEGCPCAETKYNCPKDCGSPMEKTKIKELIHNITNFVIEKGEQKEVSFGGYGIPNGSSEGYSYEFDFVSGKKYYFISVNDYEKDDIIDSIRFYYARATSDLTNKGKEGTITSRSMNLVPGIDPTVMESEDFYFFYWDNKVDGILELYQSFDCYGIKNCNYDNGTINKKLVDKRPNPITDVKINNEFNIIITQITKYVQQTKECKRGEVEYYSCSEGFIENKWIKRKCMNGRWEDIFYPMVIGKSPCSCKDNSVCRKGYFCQNEICKNKISSELLQIISQTNPAEKINVIVVPIPTEHQTVGLCSWCSTFNWLCKITTWFCNLFCGTGFEFKAITSEGHIIGSIPAKNINNLTESKYVGMVLPDYDLIAKIDYTESKIKIALGNT